MMNFNFIRGLTILTIVFTFISGTFCQTSDTELICKIGDTQKFVEKMSVTGIKTVDFLIIGLTDKASINHFCELVLSEKQILSVKVSNKNKEIARKVVVKIAEKGSMNDFRLMLMAASVKTLITPKKTFDVLHLPVKNPNPFE